MATDRSLSVATPALAVSPPRPKSKSHFLSGALSGTLSAIALQPVDLLKTRLQQAPPQTTATRTLLLTLRSIAAGPSPIRQLWRGAVPSAWRTGIGSGLYFMTLNGVRSSIAHRKHGRGTAKGSSALPRLSPLEDLVTGGAARAAVGTLLMPITVIKVRYESSLYSYTSLISASRDILRSEGLRGFFSGWGATAIRDAPYAGLYVVFYEQGKKTFARLAGAKDGGIMDAKTSSMVNVASALEAAALASAVTNPFDALKTRIQIDPEKYRNVWHAAKIVLAERSGGRWGGRALFDGLGLRMGRKLVSSSAVWGLYEWMVR